MDKLKILPQNGPGQDFDIFPWRGMGFWLPVPSRPVISRDSNGKKMLHFFKGFGLIVDKSNRNVIVLTLVIGHRRATWGCWYWWFFFKFGGESHFGTVELKNTFNTIIVQIWHFFKGFGLIVNKSNGNVIHSLTIGNRTQESNVRMLVMAINWCNILFPVKWRIKRDSRLGTQINFSIKTTTKRLVTTRPVTGKTI